MFKYFVFLVVLCKIYAVNAASCPGPHERFDCSSACDTECATLNETCPIVNIKCNEKCYCDDGYARNYNGTCIPIANCSNQCDRPHEEYILDKKTCPPNTCESLVARYKCDPNEKGRPGCVCKSGFLRKNENSTCIPIHKCPQISGSTNVTCGSNEIFSECPSDCREFCPTSDAEVRNCAKLRPAVCPPPRCTCLHNYRRAKNGNCIPASECPPFNCPRPNEMYDSCPPLCPLNDYRQATIDGRCLFPRRIAKNAECRPVCRCKPGYWRRHGRCIRYKNCPNVTAVCPGRHEHFDCGSFCDTTCATLNQPCPIVNKKCVEQCYCDEGYARNVNNRCVHISECSKQCPNPNEEFKQDKKNCPPETCDRLVALYKCDSKEKGKPGCACKPGFLRKYENSTCIPTDQCFQTKITNMTCGPNEELNNCPSSCLDSCPKSEFESRACSSLQTTSCPPPRCICRFNYRRHFNGTCIPSRECPPFKCSGLNEEYNPCPPLCPSDNCSQATPTGRCPLPGRIGIVLQCRPSCRCKKSYWRNNGVCVPYESCPNIQAKQCTRPNEEYTLDKKPCPPETCIRLVAKFKCNDTQLGQPGCVCKPGFLRKKENSTCIPTEQCFNTKQCTRPNEEYTLDKKPCPPETCIRLVAKFKCNDTQLGQPGCVCKPGFLRKKENSTCIPTEQCFNTKQCTRPNEEYTLDKKPCPPETCIRLVADFKCNATQLGQPGCVCKPGFLRKSENSTCIPTEQCFNNADCNRPNESLKCVKQCPPARTCQNRNIAFKCLFNESEICNNKCVCNEGFYRNTKGDCVTKEQCDTADCSRPNESLKCVKQCPPASTCQNRNIAVRCPFNESETCNDKCVCNEGFYRNTKGDCVTKEQCDAADCSRPNESLKCVKQCPPASTCQNRNIAFKCLFNESEICNDKCVCNEGFYRNTKGDCVTKEQCDAADCSRPNESLKCVKQCPPASTCQNRNIAFKCLFNESEICNDKCVCNEGFYRNTKGECVTKEQCDAADCSRPNESLKCVKQCPPASTCQNRNIAVRCRFNESETCNNKCVCNEGFYRNTKGDCVTKEQCDTADCSRPNESLKCVKQCPPASSCQNRNIAVRCRFNESETCNNKCVCNEGFYRNSKGECVTREQCEAEDCIRPNESLKCVKQCPPASTCQNRNVAFSCLLNITEVCNNECVCNDGFYRNSNGECVTREQCEENECGSNEILNTCPSNCGDKCIKSPEEVRACTGPQLAVCRPSRCTCRPKFCRAENGTCIPNEIKKEECGPNEILNTCPSNCGDKCIKNAEEVRACTGFQLTVCGSPRCTCRPEFCRAQNGTCIPNDQNNRTCGANEVFNECPSDCRDKCPMSDAEVCACARPRAAVCPPGRCTCIYNYRRDNNGTCIPAKQCPSFDCTKQNEQFESCPTCASDDCSQATPDGKCRTFDNNDMELECRPSCRCKKNFWRKNEICVTFKDCSVQDNTNV